MIVFAQYPGDETRVQRQAEALIGRGLAVDVLCLRGTDAGLSEPVEVVGGVQVYRLPASRSYGKASFAHLMLEYLAFFWHVMIALIRLHPRRRYGVVQVHNLPDFLVFAAWFPRMLGARIVLDMHDLMPEFLASRTGRAMDDLLVRLVKLQERLSCAFADHVITVTDLWRDTLIQRGVPASKVSVVMNVADDRVFRPRPELGSPRVPGALRLFYHGILAPRAGLDLVLEAIARLHDELPGLSFTIHGRKGDFSEALRVTAGQLGIADHVVFSHELRPVSDLPALIAASDVGVVPYRPDVFTDGILPTKLMEYAALGMPAIVARTQAVSAYFDDATAELFAPGSVEGLVSAIRRLARDRERLRSLSAHARRFGERYSWSAQSASYLALVERLGRRGAEDQSGRRVRSAR